MKTFQKFTDASTRNFLYICGNIVKMNESLKDVVDSTHYHLFYLRLAW